ncbi:Uncharacterised protein [Klebsiella pneumoniae]|nr:Uncharacterised protein [Klebsiella pneumoniae]
MGRCNRPAVAFGLDQPAFVINNDLSVSAAIPTVRRITNDRQPLSFQRQQQQFLKYIRVNFAQVLHTLTVPRQSAQFFQHPCRRSLIATVATNAGFLPLAKAQTQHHHDKQRRQKRGRQRVDQQRSTQLQCAHHGRTCRDNPVSVIITG